MSAGDVLAIVAATVVTMLVAVLGATLIALTRTLRDLRDTASALHDEAIPLLEAARDAVVDAAVEVASRLAARTLQSPVVKAMAFGTGVSRAAQKLRQGETPIPPSRRRRRR